MPDTMDGWLDEATPDEARIRICLNRRLYRELRDQLRAATAELEHYQASRKEATTLDAAVSDDTIRAAAQRAMDANKALEEAEDRELVFQCLPRRRRKQIEAEHPPTEEQKKSAPPNSMLRWNEDTFWPAMVAESCVSPGISVEQSERLREALPDDKWAEITATVYSVNYGGTDVPKSVRSIADQLNSVLSSTTAPPEESPSPSSAAAARKKANHTG
jgi:hypothetical protein